MALDFPLGPVVGQQFPFTPVPGQPVYIWDGEKWVAASSELAAVRYDVAQSLTTAQQAQARENIAVVGANTNIIINGDFRVNQTGYISAAVLSAGVYGHDQWKAGAGGGNYSFTQLKSSTQITIASGKSLIQPIEDVNVVGGSYVLTWTGTAQARAGVNTLTPSGAYAASPLLISGQTAGTVMSIEFNSGTLGTVKLEIGTNATPFVMRPYDQELMTCQRYYSRRDYPSYALFVGHKVPGTGLLDVYSVPIAMRAVPTVTMTNTANWYYTNSAGGSSPLSSVSATALTNLTMRFSGGAVDADSVPRTYFQNTVTSQYINHDARL